MPSLYLVINRIKILLEESSNTCMTGRADSVKSQCAWSQLSITTKKYRKYLKQREADFIMNKQTTE